MSRILILNKSGARLQRTRTPRTSTIFGGGSLWNKRVFSAGSAKINLVSIIFAIVVGTCICGATYLYQVNDIATKGYEIRELEGKIQELNKESKKMEIHEVELRSMYNIEKASQDLNLVNSGEVTYVEINGPVAMK